MTDYLSVVGWLNLVTALLGVLFILDGRFVEGLLILLWYLLMEIYLVLRKGLAV